MKQEKKVLPETGLRSLELAFRPVYSAEFLTQAAYRCQLRINSPRLGVLLPEQYGPVSERTVQCVHLSRWACVQAVKSMQSFIRRGVDFEWVSVYVPLRFLRTEDFAAFLASLLKEAEIEPSRFCIELDSELLIEESGEVWNQLELLQSAGVHRMLLDFGAADCPVMRLAETPVDIVRFSEEITADITETGRKRSAAESLIDFVKKQERVLMAAEVETKEQADIFETCECFLYDGSQAGKYKKERGVRA